MKRARRKLLCDSMVMMYTIFKFHSMPIGVVHVLKSDRVLIRLSCDDVPNLQQSNTNGEG